MKNNNKIVILFSLLIAFFLDIKPINVYLTKGSEEGGYMAILYMLAIGGITLVSFFFHNIKRLPSSAIFITFFLCAFYLLSSLFLGPPRVSVAFFAVFTISSFLIPHFVNISVRYTLKMMMALSAPAVLYLNQIFAFKNLYNETISMGLCYAFLTPIVASIIYMFFFFKNETNTQKIISIILFLINTVFLLYLFLYGSRGPLVAIFALLLTLFIANVSEKGQGITLDKKRLSLSILLVLIAVILGFVIFNWLNDFLISKGISIRFIEKMLILEEAGDVSNGRNQLYEWAIADFLENPILGRGLDRFSANHRIDSYPHNFILQILADGGLFLFLILFIPLIKRIRYIIRSCSIERYAILITLFFSSVPGALFSGDLWECSNLWLLFGAILSNRIVLERYE